MPAFILSFWRTISPSKDLYYFPQNGVVRLHSRNEAGFLHEKVYEWQVQEEIVDSIESGEIREAFDKKRRVFNSGAPLSQRTITELSELLAWCRENLTETKFSPSTSSQSEVQTISSIPAQTFLHHLQWLCDTFQDTPNLYVMIH